MVEIKVPTPGESINEVEIASWMVKDGDLVIKNQDLAEIESDKATLTLVATESGKISILIDEGSSVAVNSIACIIDTSFAQEAETTEIHKTTLIDEVLDEKAKDNELSIEVHDEINTISVVNEHVKVSPLAHKLMEENELSIEDVLNGLRRLTKSDVETVIRSSGFIPDIGSVYNKKREVSRKKISQLRKKLGQRLVAVKNETAMLTTFNEVDISAIINLRKKYQKDFVDRHGVKLGFMSFFLKASAVAMVNYPMVNSAIDNDEIVTPGYVDISVAVQTPKGLMVPVIRNVEMLELFEIELKLKDLADKARAGKITVEEMTGGTFSITNGGVFGSMLSTPLINPPQSAILGMHNINDRPVAIEGKVEIRPIMFIALSYDHRIIDGKDSVGFLKMVKELLENPVLLITKGEEPDRLILNI
ncbi:MAG: dihydrolipoyllysine-residue succinyltransferase [Marinilabiliaceae bacterium]|nr:dihydrolipoyllysine-residue succinyltransferase [Marinilabiliaceae bacterium]